MINNAHNPIADCENIRKLVQKLYMIFRTVARTRVHSFAFHLYKRRFLKTLQKRPTLRNGPLYVVTFDENHAVQLANNQIFDFAEFERTFHSTVKKRRFRTRSVIRSCLKNVSRIPVKFGRGCSSDSSHYVKNVE